MRPAVPDGLTVRYEHHRRGRTPSGLTFTVSPTDRRHLSPEDTILPTGGVTVAHLVDDAGNEIITAYAQCHDRDNYNRRIGRDIARGRAIKHYLEARS